MQCRLWPLLLHQEHAAHFRGQHRVKPDANFSTQPAMSLQCALNKIQVTRLPELNRGEGRSIFCFRDAIGDPHYQQNFFRIFRDSSHKKKIRHGVSKQRSVQRNNGAIGSLYSARPLAGYQSVIGVSLVTSAESLSPAH
jgi:hypothetical protein